MLRSLLTLTNDIKWPSLIIAQLLALILMINNPVSAENTLTECNIDDCIQVGNWKFSIILGLGLRTNLLNDSDHIPLIFLPQFSYYAEQFFIENLDIGFTLLESETVQFNLIATPSYDGVFFNRWDPGNILTDINTVDGSANNLESEDESDQVPQDRLTNISPDENSERRFSYLGGLEYSYEAFLGTFQASILSELTNRHSGSEIRVAYQKALNPHFSTTLGLTWKDKKLPTTTALIHRH